MTEECRFCQIATGELDAHVLAETDDAMAFLDANPAVRGHTLVMPRTHRDGVTDMTATEWTAVFRLAQRLASALDAALEPDGFSVFHTTGTMVGTVDHAHVHVLPRTRNDEISLSLARDDLELEQADSIVDRVRDAL